MSRLMKIAVILLLAVTLTGCFQASLVMTITPNPITYEYGKEAPDIKFKLRTQGFGVLQLNRLILELLDEDGASANRTEINLGTSAVVVPGVGRTEIQPLNLPFNPSELSEEDYIAQYKGKTYTLKVTITGGKDVTAEAQVVFE